MKESKAYPYLKALLDGLIEAAPNWMKAPGKFVSSLSEQLQSQSQKENKQLEQEIKSISEEELRKLIKESGYEQKEDIELVVGNVQLIPEILGTIDYRFDRVDDKLEQIIELLQRRQPFFSIGKQEIRGDLYQAETIYIEKPTEKEEVKAKQVTLVIDNLEAVQFDSSYRRLFCFGIAGFLGIDPSDVRIVNVEAGSVRVTVEIPEYVLGMLLEAVQNGDVRLAEAVKPLSVLPVDEGREFGKADFVIITALEKEAKAVVKRLEGQRVKRFEKRDIRTYRCGTVQVQGTTNVYRVVVLLLPRVGNVAAANAVTDAMSLWQPRFVLMVGIAAGIPESDVELGDVLIADQVVGYEYGKVKAEGIERNDRVYPGSALLLERVHSYWDEKWIDDIRVARPKTGSRSKPRLLVGPIASGNKVVAATWFREKLRHHWPKLVGVEMEGEGVFSATFDRPQIPGTLVIRGVCDLADELKSDEWQEYAADAAAAFTIGFLRSGPVEAEAGESDRGAVSVDDGSEGLATLSETKVSEPFAPSLHNQTAPEENFVGREEYLKTITGWYKNPEVRIGALIGWGGVGKSALVRKWYDSLEANKIQPDGIFWWGFYRNAFLEQFLNALLRYVSGGQIEPETIKGTWEKVDRIKEYINQGAYLIVLDGLEEMQKGQTSGDEFGCMAHRECTDMLKFIADTKGDGLCLITTRYPLTDIKKYEKTVYQKEEIERLSKEDGRRLFEKVGVTGSKEEIDSVINEYDGHALSLTLLSKYLVEDFEGDITKAKEIPAFYSDEEAGGKAHRILLWYAKQLTEEQSGFMKIFSLFRRAVREEDFEGVFRARMETEMNQALAATSEFAFKRMVDNLVDRRLITKDRDGTYATHPLIKNYFESIFDEEDKKLCHKRIYEYFGEYAPKKADTLQEMQPLFEQVYHGCAAGLYDEVYDDVYLEKINKRTQNFITHKLGAWETDFSLVKTFFPEGDLSRMPLVSEKRSQSWLLNSAGLALLTTGRPKEAEEPFLTGNKMDIEAEDWVNASGGYELLADLRFRTGELESGLDSAKKALEMAEKARSDNNIVHSKAYLGWILYLLGKTEEAEKKFREADELQMKIDPDGDHLYSIWGVFYADFLISIKRIDEAFELTKKNLEICQRYNAINDISRCHRCLGAIERMKGNYKEAENHLQKAIDKARKIGVPDLQIEALLEYAQLRLDMGKHDDAIGDADNVLKICGRTGFMLYEPGAEMVLAKAYVALKDFEQAIAFANSAYEKAVGMKYRWAEGDAADLLGEIYSAKGDKVKAREWLKKAVACRKKILDPKVKESETILAGLR